MKKIFLSGFVLFAFTAFGQTAAERAEIVKNYDLEKLSELSMDFQKEYTEQKAFAVKKAKKLNLPLSFIDAKGSYNELMRFQDGQPIYYATHNDGSAVTIKVNEINTGGVENLDLNGQSMILGIWDGGPVRGSHQDLTGRVIIKDLNSFLSSDESTEHATHVAGTMIGSGFGNANAKGMAYEATLWGNTFANDLSEATQQASQGLLVSNHSYGIPIANIGENFRGKYSSEARQWDILTYNTPYYQPVISAGNDRNSAQDNTAGRDLLIGNKNSKNAIIVAAVQEVSNYTSPSSVTMTSFSSWGPTDDFRIKPDISAKGLSVFSCWSTSDTSYSSIQGTSMASPAIAGALILMQQHYNDLNNTYMRAATLKGLMTNSASEAGFYTGPDFQFGWGLLNAQKAIQTISKVQTEQAIISEHTLNDGATYTTSFTSDGSEQLRVTLAWTDRAATVAGSEQNDTTSRLVNDLDVRVFKDDEEYFPWVLNVNFVQGQALKQDNPFDNIERIDIDVSEPGSYQLVVSHKGSLVGGSQDFSIIASGIENPMNALSFQDKNVVLSPNPAASNFVISGIDASNIENVKIYDSLGRSVKFNQTDSTKINIQNLQKGMYLVVLKTKSGADIVEKLIKK